MYDHLPAGLSKEEFVQLNSQPQVTKPLNTPQQHVQQYQKQGVKVVNPTPIAPPSQTSNSDYGFTEDEKAQLNVLNQTKEGQKIVSALVKERLSPKTQLAYNQSNYKFNEYVNNQGVRDTKNQNALDKYVWDSSQRKYVELKNQASTANSRAMYDNDGKKLYWDAKAGKYVPAGDPVATDFVHNYDNNSSMNSNVNNNTGDAYDAQAISWAKSNRGNPDAEEILRIHGLN
jgi:hypothetical protein